MYETVTNNHFIVTRDQELDLSPTLAVSEELRSAADQQTMDIMNLMRYPDYDSYTVGHSVRVSTLALTVGKEMGWPEHMWTELASAGLLHDLGKGKVPEEILYKPGKLTDEERKVAESHAAIGANILLAQGDASPLCVAAAWGHHIRSDGGGYPKVPAWAVKSPIAGLIQVCDVFEALTAARPYKNPLPPRRAFEIILKDRHAFDPGPVVAHPRHRPVPAGQRGRADRRPPRFRRRARARLGAAGGAHHPRRRGAPPRQGRPVRAEAARGEEARDLRLPVGEHRVRWHGRRPHPKKKAPGGRSTTCSSDAVI